MIRTAKLLFCILLLFVLTACASKNENDAAAKDDTVAQTETQDRKDNAAHTETQDRKDSAAQTETQDRIDNAAHTETQDRKDSAVQTETQDREEIAEQAGESEKERNIPDELTQEEKDFFTEFMNSTENNGFLNSEYTAATDVNLAEVFYNGAGVSAHSLTAEEEAAYEEATGWEIYTDVERLTTEEIDRFLLRKTGYSYAEMNTPLAWTYLAQYDVYVSDHGDTNWKEYRCIGGRAQEDVYAIYYETAYYEGDEFIGILTLKKNGDDYLIVSNQWRS